jgi:hypothetical protein
VVDLYLKKIPIIRKKFDEGWLDQIGEMHAGYEERDYSVDPQEMFASPDEMDLIPESEWDARYEEREAQQSGLEHLYVRDGKPAFKHLDQNPQGFCWAYSSTHAVMLQRLAMGQPVVRLSAHAVACKIKNFRDQGGWGGQSAKFITENGCPSVEAWPEKSMKRQYDTPEVWKDAEKYKITDQWVDLTKQVYDQNLTRAQMATAGFLNQPGPVDFNWAGHSVCRLGWVRIEKGSWGPLILNSWWGWGYHGLGVLAGNKGVPNGALAIRSVTIS